MHPSFITTVQCCLCSVFYVGDFLKCFCFLVQVFYYLGELNDSLSYALGAGSLFDVSDDSDYVHTLLGKFTDVSL